MNIREATKEDVPQILPVWRELMDFHAERDEVYMIREGAEETFSKYLCENIEKDDSCIFVAQNNHDIVGYCQCKVVESPPVLVIEKYGNVEGMAVLEKYRRSGVGRLLVKQAMQWFKAKGLERVEVRVSVVNEISIKFWRKVGFEAYLETMFKQA